VLVVDEVSVSGDTLRIACSLISRAFPDANVSAAHWMTPRLVNRTGSRFNNQVPVWYREGTPFGRLVGDRNPEVAGRSFSWRTRSAAWFLSLRHEEPDPGGVILRSEAMQLFGDVVLGRLPLVASFDREPFNEWCEALTGMSASELRAWRETNDVHLAP
jgi:hypothetical protein